MSNPSKYWKLAKLKSSGGYTISEMADAKTFFTSAFPEFANWTQVRKDLIESQLIQWVRQPESEQNSQGAELCLLCFISSEILLICLHLEERFGAKHGFKCHDLLPFVLDEPGLRPVKTQPYLSLSRQILQSFDPKQSSLATWTNRKVKFHPELNAFLLERGVYQVSNWAILNDTKPQQLHRILSLFHQRTPQEVEHSGHLLNCYHAVYRDGRSRQPGKRCQPPTPSQYQQMAELLIDKIDQKWSGNLVAAKLQELASRLREYRVYVRGKYLSTQTLDTAEPESWADRLPAPESSQTEHETEVSEFLNLYRQQLMQGLDISLATVTNLWVEKLKRRDQAKSQQFLTALYLFHCQGKSMGEIAQLVGLKAQYQVSRLLKLKSFRAEIRQKLVNVLQERLLEFLQKSDSFDAERLAIINQPLIEALDEQVNQLIVEAESDSHTAKQRTTECAFSQKLCGYLDNTIE